MCPHADLVMGRATALDRDAREVEVDVTTGERKRFGFDSLVVALGGISRTVDIPGLVENATGFKDLDDAIHLRNHVLEQLEWASAADSDEERKRHLSFVFVGGGYAGVEAMAELEDLVNDAVRRYPRLRRVRRRWTLVEASDRILRELPPSLAEYAGRQLMARGIDIRTGTTLTAVDAEGATLSTGEHVPAATVVWTAGVRAHPLAAQFELPVDEHGRVEVDGHLHVKNVPDVWALGDAAAVPNAANDGAFDPPTCQHALRQARALATNIMATVAGNPLKPYRYRTLGQVATLGQHKGVAEVFGVKLHGWPGWWFTRTYHLYQLPLASRKLRVVSDWTVGLLFSRDVVELGSLGEDVRLPEPKQ